MRAMILAAGQGSRMGSLTARTPKPLLKVGDRLLIEYSILSLVQAKVADIVINVSYYAEKIKAVLGNGQRYGVNFHYSEEENRLETGGGIVKALPFLGNEPFIVISSDIICDYPLIALPSHPKSLAHLVMVDNPLFHPQGDFALVDGYACFNVKPTLTFANIGVYHPDLFKGAEATCFPLKELLFPAIQKKLVTGEHYKKRWFNVGTKEALEEAALALC